MLQRLWIAGAVLVVVLASSARAHADGPRLLAPLSLAADMVPLAQVHTNQVDDPQPSSGTGLIVVGWIALGVGVLNLATLPICFADFYPSDAEDMCVGLSLVLAGGGIALGVPFLIIGYNNRSDYKAWRERHPVARHLLDTRIALVENGLLLSYRGEL